MCHRRPKVASRAISRVGGRSRPVASLLAIAVAIAVPATCLATTAEVASAISAYVSPNAWLRVFAASDGTFWIVTLKSRAGAAHDSVPLAHPFPLSRRGPAIHLRHLDGRGRQLGRDIVLTEVPELDEIDGVELIGFGPGGSLYLWCISGKLDPVWDLLALADSNGVKAVSPRLNKRGIAHVDRWRTVVSPSGRLRVFDCVGNFLISHSNRRLTITSEYRFAGKEVPPHLLWRGRRALAPMGADKFLAAIDRTGQSMSLYMCDLQSMNLRDSGVLRRSDTLYSLDVRVPDRTVLVPADSGFWLYVPVSDSWSAFLTPDETANRVVVFAINSSLKPQPREGHEGYTIQPFTSAGPEAVRVVRVNMMTSSSVLGQMVGLDFWAYGADGHLYYSAETTALRGASR
jgi:hypothetical protein